MRECRGHRLRRGISIRVAPYTELRDLTNAYEAANAAAYGSALRKRQGAAA